MVHVGIIMGSQSDWPTMKHAADILDALKIPYESKIVSAHRTPDRLWAYSTTAIERGLKVIIAGAGGAAHLPGMVASKTRIPVVGVPVQTKALSGIDSLYSILQMPKGYPVATMWILCGYYVATMWLPCGYYEATMWLPCGCLVLSLILISDLLHATTPSRRPQRSTTFGDTRYR